jgi:uncharacterized protein (TIGR02301 family)
MHKQLSHKIASIAVMALLAVLPALPANGQSVVRSQDYYRDVITLSETLGKAHAVRVVCNGRNDQYWRSYMQRLLELEAPYQGGLRRSMVNGFNAGFSTGKSLHQVCDSNTVAAEKTYATTGRDLAASMVRANIPGSTP